MAGNIITITIINIFEGMEILKKWKPHSSAVPR